MIATDVTRERETRDDPGLKIVEHENGEFSIALRAGDTELVRRITKAEAVRFAMFITRRK